MVKKFEKPNKKRKKNWDKNKSIDSEISSAGIMSVYEDGKSLNGLLKPGTLKSQGDRASTAPNTPSWSRHATQDSGVCFPPPNDQTHNTHLMPYPQQYDHSAPIDSRYSSYDEGTMGGSNSSPGSAYPSSTTSAGSMHMMYPNSTQPVSLGYSAPIHGLPTMQSQDDGMMSGMVLPSQGRPQVTTVYTAVTETEDRNWSATPASYMPAQAQTFATASFY